MLSQRLIFIIILSNLIIGMAEGIYYSPDNYSTDYMDNEIDIGEETAQNFREDDLEVAKDPNQITEETAGDTNSWSIRLWSVMRRGIKPLPFTGVEFETDTELIIARSLQLYRALCYMLIALEIFFILKNKKQT